jgi:hypothetical protein
MPSLRSTLAIFAGVLFVLLPAADAGAAPQLEPNATPAMDLSLGVATTDWQGTHFMVPATCNAPGPDQMTCMAHVVLSAQRTAAGKWKPAGPVTTLAQTEVIVEGDLLGKPCVALGPRSGHVELGRP